MSVERLLELAREVVQKERELACKMRELEELRSSLRQLFHQIFDFPFLVVKRALRVLGWPVNYYGEKLLCVGRMFSEPRKTQHVTLPLDVSTATDKLVFEVSVRDHGVYAR